MDVFILIALFFLNYKGLIKVQSGIMQEG